MKNRQNTLANIIKIAANTVMQFEAQANSFVKTKNKPQWNPQEKNQSIMLTSKATK